MISININKLLALTLVIATAAAFTVNAAGNDVDSLLAKGDDKFKSGDFRGALDLFKQAQTQSQDEIRVHYRIAKTAYELKDRQAGLQAIQRINVLNPELASDKELVAMTRGFEAMPEADSDSAKAELNPELQITLKTVDQLIKEAISSDDLGKREKLADVAREKLAPWISETPMRFQPTIGGPFWKEFESQREAWRRAAEIAIAKQDADFGAFAFVAMTRLSPNYLTNHIISGLVIELNKMPIDTRASTISNRWNEFLQIRRLNSKWPSGRLQAAENLLAGKYLPQWKRGGIMALEQLSDLPEPPVPNSADWQRLFDGEVGEEFADKVKSDYREPIMQATLELAYIFAIGLFDVQRDDKRAVYLIERRYKQQKQNWQTLAKEVREVDPPSQDKEFAVAAAGIALGAGTGNVNIWRYGGAGRFPLDSIKCDVNWDLSLKWLERSLDAWGDFKKRNPEAVISYEVLAATAVICANYLFNGNEGKRDRREKLRGSRLLEKAIPFCIPAPTLTEYAELNEEGNRLIKMDYDDMSRRIAGIKEMLGSTYYNLGVDEWNGDNGPRNKSKGESWLKLAARFGCEQAKETLGELGIKW